MQCDTPLGIIDVAKFLENEFVPLDFDLFTALLARKSGYTFTPIPLKDIYAWTITNDGNFINIKKKRSKKEVSQRISKKVIVTPEFIFNAALYDAEGGTVKSNTLVSNSDERIVRNIFQWYSAFQPNYEGIREVRLFMHVDEAKTIFDLNKIQMLIQKGEISSKNASNVNQFYSILESFNVIKDSDKLNKLLQKYLSVSNAFSTLTNKLRIKWDPQHKKTVFEVYYSNTLKPFIVSLTHALLFNVPRMIKKKEEIEWIDWVEPKAKFLSMGYINLSKEEFLSKYERKNKVGDKYLKISRGKEDLIINSLIKVSPTLLFGLAHSVAEKFSTGSPLKLSAYYDFIAAFGDPKNLVRSISIVLLAEEYAVLMKRLVKLFDKSGYIRDINSRHKELERKLSNFLFSTMERKTLRSKVSLNKIPYKEGIAVIMFHFPKLFDDLKELSKQDETISKAIEEVISERGLGRHAGKASFHMEFKGTVYPLINTLSEKALTNFCDFFNNNVK
jgi:hypothetical protein